MVVFRPPVTLALLAVAAALGVGLVLFTIFYRKQKKGGNKRRATAAPPFRPPTESDRILARLINSVNHDMRSIELGRWFLRQLRGVESACDAGASTDALRSIARRVPGANDVARAEILGHLMDLTKAACASGNDFGATIDAIDWAAFGERTGLLLGMPGYSIQSPVPLPT